MVPVPVQGIPSRVGTTGAIPTAAGLQSTPALGRRPKKLVCVCCTCSTGGGTTTRTGQSACGSNAYYCSSGVQTSVSAGHYRRVAMSHTCFGDVWADSQSNSRLQCVQVPVAVSHVQMYMHSQLCCLRNRASSQHGRCERRHNEDRTVHVRQQRLLL